MKAGPTGQWLLGRTGTWVKEKKKKTGEGSSSPTSSPGLAGSVGAAESRARAAVFSRAPKRAAGGPLDGGVVCRNDDADVSRGRGAARMGTVTQGVPCSIEDGHGFLVF